MSIRYLHKIQKYLTNVTGVILLFGAISCQEKYEPDDLDNNEKIPVIEGIITNGNDICYIQVSWATPFDEDYTKYISNALVSLEDTNGNIEYLTPKDRGRYYTSPDGLTRQIGEKYKIQVRLDGQVYETGYKEIPEPVYLDSIYPKYDEKLNIGYNIYGKLIIQENTKGIKIMHLMGKNIHETKFFRFSFKVLSQFLYGSGYMWNIMPFKSAVKFASVKPEQIEYKLNKYETVFLTYYEENDIQTNFVIKSDGWVIETSGFTFNSMVYNYYNAVETQINADNKVFDPIPSQIVGNLTCISDSSKIVLGVIEFSTKTVDYHAVYWDGDSKDKFKNIRLDNYQMPNSGGFQDTMPDFYIDFRQIPY